MKLTKSQLKEMIKEELLNEFRPTKNMDPKEAGKMVRDALGELQSVLKRAKNPEKWASKYSVQLPGFIESIKLITHLLGKMK